MAQTDFNTSKTKFKHLLYHERVLLAFMLKQGYTQTGIAQELGVNRSTVSREIHRGSVLQIVAGKTVKRYFAETAQSIADASKANVGRKTKFFTCGKFIEYADTLMKEKDFSPDAGVGQALDLDLFRPEEMVCTNTLYRYIDSGILTTKNIDLTQKLSRKPRNVYARDNKRVFGKSITADNGSEFAELFSCMDQTSTEVYYVHPYSSWERGANERNNGMIRRFIPKGFDASLVTEALVRKVENWLNRYPRKILGYASSFDIFYEYTGDLVA